MIPPRAIELACQSNHLAGMTVSLRPVEIRSNCCRHLAHPPQPHHPEGHQGMSSTGTIEAYSRMLCESSSKMRTLYLMLIFLNPSRSYTCGN